MNKLFVVVGHSGAGKTSIMRSIMSNEVVSFTTRPMRDGEADGYDYHFITFEKFEKLRGENGIVEYTEYASNLYGMTLDAVSDALREGNAFTIVDIAGLMHLKEFLPDEQVVSIFIWSPFEDARNRLRVRGDSEESVEKRLNFYQYLEERATCINCDYVVPNREGEMFKARDIIRSIINMETSSI